MQTGLGLGLLSQLPAHADARLHWQTSTFTGLGTTLSLRAAHADEAMLAVALAGARDVVARVESQMSLFMPTSAIQRLNREGVLHQPPPDLLKILHLSQRLSAQSHGAFDVTVQPLWTLYAEAHKQARLPTAAQVHAVRQRVGWQHMQVSAERVTFARPAMGITLNGIAQGYASDLVRAHLKQAGVSHALINTGEWSSLGQAEGQRDWTLGIADPHQADRLLARLHLRGLCVATSADAPCTFSADRVHHHIFDPATGDSPRDISSVTVAATSCTLADALTKVLFVGGYAQALRLAQAWQVAAWVVHKDGRWQASPSLLQHLAT
jgi:thiamine biosynthesis lipoprotein